MTMKTQNLFARKQLKVPIFGPSLSMDDIKSASKNLELAIKKKS